MDSLIFQEKDTIERINMLESNADDIIEDYPYERVLSEEELADLKTDYADTQIEVERLEKTKRDYLETINAEIKGKQKYAKETLSTIKTRRVETIETVYVIKDENLREIGTYNNRGELISSKTMRGGGHQYRIPVPIDKVANG